MKLSIEFGRWTTTKAALAVAGALAIAGAVGSAVAFSPIIAPPLKWQGGAEFHLVDAGGAIAKAYTVPAGRNFLLTDFTATNGASAQKFFSILAGAGGNCDVSLVDRLEGLVVPPENNTVLAFQTGIGFAAGQAVCIVPSSAGMTFNGRGFLFTAAPAS